METFGNQKDEKNEQIFYCEYCDYKSFKKYNYERHMANGKHKMPPNGNFWQLLETFGNKKDKNDKNDKNEQKFYCKICDYNTSVKCNYERHLKTNSHLKNEQKMLKNEQKDQKDKNDKNEEQKNCKFQCVCGKKYQNKSGLWKHKNKCIELSKNTENENQIVAFGEQDKSMYNLVLEVLKQNKEIVVELCKSNNNTNTNTNNQNSMIDSHNEQNNNTITTHSHNKTFNLQVFLNEKCKNAMNLMDFVDSLEPELSDLENVGRLGFVNGLSNIIIKNLKALDVTLRPVHCSDSKRETVYVKDNDEWEKDDENKSKLRKAVKNIADKNVKLIPLWKKKYPDYLESTSKQSDQYNNLVIEVLGGDDESSVNEDKVMKKIVREVVIDKHVAY